MDIDILLKLTMIGLVAIIANILVKRYKEEIAQIITLVAIIICLIILVDMIAGLFDNIRSIFRLY